MPNPPPTNGGQSVLNPAQSLRKQSKSTAFPPLANGHLPTVGWPSEAKQDPLCPATIHTCSTIGANSGFATIYHRFSNEKDTKTLRADWKNLYKTG